MTIERVDVNRGIGWIQDGWADFIRLPGLWILLMLVLLAIVVILNLLPWVGSLLVALISPVLGASALEAARRSAGGGDFTMAVLLEPTARSGVLNNLLVLGAVSLAVNALIMGLGLMFIGSTALGMGMMHGGEDAWVGFGAGALISIPLMLTLHTVLTAALFFAVPLVMAEREPPLQAMQSSLKACLVNWAPLLLFGLIATILGFIAMIPMGLGFLILGPVLTGAVWTAYTEIFPVPIPTGQVPVPTP